MTVTSASALVAALLAAHPGDTIELAPGRYLAPPGGFVVSHALLVEGPHPSLDRMQAGAIIVPASPDDHAVVVTSRNVTLKNLMVRGVERPGKGDGIHIELAETGACVRLEDCMVWGAGWDGISAIGPKGGSIDELRIVRCISHRNGGSGIRIRGCYGPSIEHAYCARNAQAGVSVEYSDGALLLDVAAEGNPVQVVVQGGTSQTVLAPKIENFATGVSMRGVLGGTIQGGAFLNPKKEGTSIELIGCKSCWIGLNTHRHVARMVVQDDACSAIDVARQAEEP